MRERKKVWSRKDTSMWKLTGYEMKKIFGRVWVWLLLLAGLAAAGYEDVRSYMDSEEYYRAGKTFFEICGGTVTESTYTDIKSLANGTHPKINDSFVGMWATSVMNKELPYLVQVKSARETLLADAEKNLQFFTEKGMDYERRINEIVLKKYAVRPSVRLVDAEDYKKYFDNHYSLMYPMLLITLLLGTIFTNEKESRSEMVLAASAAGRKGFFRIKLTAAALSGGLVMLLFIIMRTVLQLRLFPLTDWEAPVQSIPLFARCPLDWSMRTMAVAAGGLQCLAAMLHGIAVALLSCLMKRNLSGIAAGALWYLAGYLVYVQLLYNGMAFGVDVSEYGFQHIKGILEHFFYPMLLEPQNYFLNLAFVNVCGYPVPVLLVCILSSGAIMGTAAAIVRKGYVYGKR